METRDSSFWSKIISPGLRDQVMPQIAVTADVSKAFVACLPLEECGDFVWAIVCLGRWIPETALEKYRPDMKSADGLVREALLAGALNAVDFYDCPEAL